MKPDTLLVAGMSAISGRKREWFRVAWAAAAYALLLFAVYLVTGPARASGMDRMLGPAIGAVAEAAAFIPVILLGGMLIPRLAGLVDDEKRLVALGVVALALFLVGDVVVAEFFCRLPALEHLGRFATLPGWVQGSALAFFALFPWAWWRAPDS